MDPRKVSDAADKLSAKSDNLIRLSSGVVLEGKQARPVALLAIMTQYPRPKPPVTYIENMGRNVENELDPDYIERVKAWEQERSSTLLNALVLFGTSVKSVPKGFPRPEDNEWLDELTAIGIVPKPESKSWRYIAWVTFIAVQDEKDLMEIRSVVGSLSGVREADVKAAETFPGSDQANR